MSDQAIDPLRDFSAFRQNTGVQLVSVHELKTFTIEWQDQIRSHAKRVYPNERFQIIQQTGTWAVTKDGLRCLTDHYVIPKQDLLKDEEQLFLLMADKGWVRMYHFLKAFYDARRHHYPERFK